MDGIEALKAMKEGKIIKYANTQYCYKKDNLMEFSEDEMDWIVSPVSASFFVNECGFEIVEQTFNLTFVEALRAMLNGNKVCNEIYPDLIQYIEDGVIKTYRSGGYARITYIDTDEQTRKWRIVE